MKNISEMHVVLRYGAALLTANGTENTAVATFTITNGNISMNVLAWYDTYIEALTALQAAATGQEIPDELEEPEVIEGTVVMDGRDSDI